MKPAGAVGDSQTRVLLAVIEIHGRAGVVTVTRLVDATGLNRSNVWRHLDALRRRGLVDWTDGRQGTLHPLVERVAV